MPENMRAPKKVAPGGRLTFNVERFANPYRFAAAHASTKTEHGYVIWRLHWAKLLDAIVLVMSRNYARIKTKVIVNPGKRFPANSSE
jgi:hypothetical protein